jgi:N-acetylneuraminate synthase
VLFDLKRSVYVIAEAGSNWRMGTPERDQEMARSLIDVAAASGADAVKFQTYRPESVYVRNAGESGYLAGAGIKKSIYDIFADLAMPYEMLEGLADYCGQKGVAFMSTPFSVADAEAVDPFVGVHKVASYEINHVRLLQWLAKTGKPLILSSGAADQDDIAFALETLREAGAEDVVLMQCTAKYPAPFDSLNLKAIMQLQERFQVPVGFSDHSREPVVAPVAAVALGARVIEKHFTLHNRLPGPDHAFALCPDELGRMVSAIRDAEKTLGSGEKAIHAEERELREFAVRSLQAMRDIQIGETLQEGVNFDVLRSGQRSKGLHPKYLGQVEGTRAKVLIAAGQGIRKDDLEGM